MKSKEFFVGQMNQYNLSLRNLRVLRNSPWVVLQACYEACVEHIKRKFKRTNF